MNDGAALVKMAQKTWKVSQFWNEFETMLLEAVRKNSYQGVKLLLEHELKLEDSAQSSALNGSATSSSASYSKGKNTSSVILAAKNGNLNLLKLFLKYNYTIPPPHYTDCQCHKCTADKLRQSKHRIETMKALSNPYWISLTSDDPFLTAFKLRNLSEKFGAEDDSCENQYVSIAKQNVEFCLELLDEIETEAECICLMKHKKYKEERGEDVAFINMAIEYEQKEVYYKGVFNFIF